MAKRTRIVCLHEGEKGRSIDPVFITRLLNTLKPSWIRPWKGSNIVRTVDCGGRTSLIARMPTELKAVLAQGGETTLMVWADVDDDPPTPVALRTLFHAQAKAEGMSEEQFDQVVFIFARDRLENWIEFLNTGVTDEDREGPRVNNREAADAAKRLAARCRQEQPGPPLPRSLHWSCLNWKALAKRMSAE
jgi:hypothetical protein